MHSSGQTVKMTCLCQVLAISIEPTLTESSKAILFLTPEAAGSTPRYNVPMVTSFSPATHLEPSVSFVISSEVQPTKRLPIGQISRGADVSSDVKLGLTKILKNSE